MTKKSSNNLPCTLHAKERVFRSIDQELLTKTKPPYISTKGSHTTNNPPRPFGQYVYEGPVRSYNPEEEEANEQARGLHK